MTGGLMAIAVLTSPSAAFAQGCAMCYTSAAAAKAGAIQALRSGVLILLVPPLVMFTVIFVVIYRRRNRFSESGEWIAEHDRELNDLLGQLESDVRSQEPDVSRPLSVVSCNGQRTTDHRRSHSIR